MLKIKVKPISTSVKEDLGNPKTLVRITSEETFYS